MKALSITLGVLFVLGLSSAVYSEKNGVYKQGDLSNTGGTATVRYAVTPQYEDDPYTTNYETNDQAVGFYGTETMNVCNQSSGNCYDLDVELSDGTVERIYFPKGGWVDMEGSDCYAELCFAMDENGTQWVLEFI